MSHRATTWAFSVRGLKPATRVVLLYLADRHNPDQGCFPSQARLAADCELSRSALNEHLSTLEALGLICREQRRGDGNRQLPTSYKFAFEEGFTPAKEAESRVQNPDTESEVPCPENGDFRVRISGNSVSGLPDSEPVREPVSESLSAPAREEPADADEREGETSGSEGDRDQRQALRAFKRFGPTWPTWVSDSEPQARRAWLALPASERERAAELAPTYLEAERAAGRRHTCSLGVYLSERRWEKLAVLPKPKAQGVVEFPPYGKGWMAQRIRVLKTTAPRKWRPTAIAQRLIDQGRDDLVADQRRQALYPLVHAMDIDAERGLSVRIRAEADPPAESEFEAYVRIRRGSEQWRAWEAWHHARDWPWISPPPHVEWIFVPTEWPQNSATEAAE